VPVIIRVRLRTRVTDDTVSVAAVVPLQVFGAGCVTVVHEATHVIDTSMIVDGHTIRVPGDTFLHAVLHKQCMKLLTAVAVRIHQLLHVTRVICCQT